MSAVRAVLADDERLLRAQLRQRLAEAWPELQITGEARDGREAVEMVAALQPELVFLDIRMPVLSGIEAAAQISQLPDLRCHIVFVTAYDQYAVEAFEHGALDYVLKPAETMRLARTVQRLQERLKDNAPADLSDRLRQIEGLLQRQHDGPAHLRWLQASQGNLLKLIAVDDVLFFRSDEKYTRIRTTGGEWLIRTPLRELLSRLDEQQFWQVHRSTIVNARAIAHLERQDSRLLIHLRDHGEVLEVSRSHAERFRQM